LIVQFSALSRHFIPPQSKYSDHPVLRHRQSFAINVREGFAPIQNRRQNYILCIVIPTLLGNRRGWTERQVKELCHNCVILVANELNSPSSTRNSVWGGGGCACSLMLIAPRERMSWLVCSLDRAWKQTELVRSARHASDRVILLTNETKLPCGAAPESCISSAEHRRTHCHSSHLEQDLLKRNTTFEECRLLGCDVMCLLFPRNVFVRSVLHMLVTVNVLSALILSTMMMEVIRSSKSFSC
jgi:hypothetical protein